MGRKPTTETGLAVDVVPNGCTGNDVLHVSGKLRPLRVTDIDRMECPPVLIIDMSNSGPVFWSPLWCSPNCSCSTSKSSFGVCAGQGLELRTFRKSLYRVVVWNPVVGYASGSSGPYSVAEVRPKVLVVPGMKLPPSCHEHAP